jgi:hypothetical protein
MSTRFRRQSKRPSPLPRAPMRVKVGPHRTQDGPIRDAWTGRWFYVVETTETDYGLSNDAGGEAIVWINRGRCTKYKDTICPNRKKPL